MAFLRGVCTKHFGVRQPTEERPYPKTKFIVFFDDPLNIPILEAVARAYADADSELSADIRSRLLSLHPDKF